MLVVLDNASSDRQVVALLPRQRVHRCLVTTRDTLTFPSARTLDLDVLDLDEAVDLLTRSLTRRYHKDERVADDPVSAARVVQVCGRLPLAVEVTAALLADERSLSLEELAEELDNATTRLEGLQYGQRAVTAVFDGSWRRLLTRQPKAAELLRLLPVNPGPDMSTDAVAALAGVTEVQVRKLLRILRQACFVQYFAGRWGMHDLMRLYIHHHVIDDSGRAKRDAATDRLLTH